MAALSVLRRCLFFVSIPLFFVNFALPIQAKALGASALEIGGLFSLFSLSLLLLRPVIGVGIDRLGRRLFFLMALVFYTGAYAGYAFAEGIEEIYIARFCQGLAAALLLITVDTMTADLTSIEDRGRAMGANLETQTRASILGATIGFTLVAFIPAMAWKYSFGLFSVVALLGLFFAFFKLPETRVPVRHKVLINFKWQPEFKKLLFILFFLGFANALIQPIYLIYLQDNFTNDPRVLSWAFLPAALVFAILPSKMGALADLKGPLKLMVSGLLLTGLFYLVMPHSVSFWPFVLLYTAAAIGWSLVEPSRKAMISSHANADTYARTFGVSEMAYGLGAGLDTVKKT